MDQQPVRAKVPWLGVVGPHCIATLSVRLGTLKLGS